MYLQANPGRVRTEEEKEDAKKLYTPGENVLPKVKRRKKTSEEAEDLRMVEEARELSLRDVGIRGPGSYGRGIRHRARDGGRDLTRGDSDTGASTVLASQTRQIEHQSSLRSLLSSSDLDTSEMEEEILRQIMDEGILDGIDLNNLDVSQEDELSEKIAEAYRRRHNQQFRSRENRAAQRRSHSRDDDPAAEQRRQTRPTRSGNTPEPSSGSSHPPLSRPHLLEPYPTTQGHRRRASSEDRRQTSPTPSSRSRISSDTQRQATRSVTDLSNRSVSSGTSASRSMEARSRSERRTVSDRLQPEIRVPNRAVQGGASRSPNGRARIPLRTTTIQASTTPIAGPGLNERHQNERPRDASPDTRPTTVGTSVAVSDISSAPSAVTAQLQTYPEPSISCERCGRTSLQYDLHWNCSKCKAGNYNICQGCYRAGKGCLHWYGFGYAAMQRYERQAPPNGYPADSELPHMLKARRYVRPPSDNLPDNLPAALTDPPLTLPTTSDPSERLQSGLFCSNCSSFSPSCYWKCDVCNEGEWGFCNLCVNKGKCCTHALLPMAVTSYLSKRRRSLPTIPNNPQSSSFASTPEASGSSTIANTDPYTTLTFSTHCDHCSYPIPPSTTRFHCCICNEGDYDLCTPCYLQLMKRGTITANNGPKGWRRCPNGHRMIVVGFEDSALGQRRVVVGDLVGGHGWREEGVAAAKGQEWRWREGEKRQVKSFARDPAARSSTSADNIPPSAKSPPSPPPLLKTYPPNGGIGMCVLALWSYWPEDGVKDELGFPKGAEIRECEDINGDWFWGVYCAKKGLFPGAYGRVIGKVDM
ncbi:MAG: hypothetical protein Q9163_004398 [Psora crenata]